MSKPHHAAAAVGRGLLRRYQAHGLNDAAAALSFWAVLSVFPALIALASVLGYLDVFIGTANEQKVRDEIIDFVRRTFNGTGGEFVATIERVLNFQSGALAILGLLGALYGTSKGFSGLCRALARLEGHPETRVGIKGRIIGLLLGVGTILVVTAALLQLVLGPLFGFEELLPDDFESTVFDVWQWLRWPVILAIVIGWLGVLLAVSPGRRTWRSSLPGAVATFVLWALATVGFNIYVSLVGGANPLLGVLGGVLVALTWINLLSVGILLGGELNAELSEVRRPAPEPVTAVADLTPVEPGATAKAAGTALLLAALLGRRH